MADTKISALSDGTTPAGTDKFAVARSGANNSLTWTEMLAAMPGAEIGYDQITTGVNITATSEANSNVLITCAAHTFDGAPVLCTFYTEGLTTPTGAFGASTVSLWEGVTAGSGTEISQLCFALSVPDNQGVYPAVGLLRFTPTAASHTYTIRGYSSSTNGTPDIAAGAGGVAGTAPAFVRFTKV